MAGGLPLLLLRLLSRRFVLQTEHVGEAVRVFVRRMPQPRQLAVDAVRVLREVMRVVLTYVLDILDVHLSVFAEVVEDRVVCDDLTVARIGVFRAE